MERERASKEERRHRRAYQRQAAVTRSSAATEQPASPATGGKALGFLGQNQVLEGRSASKTAAVSCLCFALALASLLRSNPA